MKTAKKPLDKRSKNKCKKNCKGRLINKRICECLENKMPKTSKKSVRAFYAENIEQYSASSAENTPSMTSEEMSIRLYRYGLAEHEVELVIARFHASLTFLEIVDKYGWTSVGSASHCYRSALAKLRKAGFTIK